MLSAALLLALGQLSADAQALPEVRIGPVTPFTGLVETNFLHADLDGDGDLDLALPAGVRFQADGRFDADGLRPLPESSGMVEADLFGGKLYYKTATGIEIHAWSPEGWRRELAQPLPWPGGDDFHAGRNTPGKPPVFRRFTSDLNEDGSPELIALDADGVHLYRRTGDAYGPAGTLAVFPTMVINRPGVQALWPADQRRVLLPEQQMSCRLVVEPMRLAVVSALEGAAGTARYRRDRIALEEQSDGHFAVRTTETELSGELAAHLRPCYLNGDDLLDYAGTHWEISETAASPVPIQEIWASVDGGKTFHVERAPAMQYFRAQTAFADMDGDGDQDLIVEGTTLHVQGLRETMNQFLTRANVPHTIRIVRQEQGAFVAAGPTFHTEIILEAPPVSPGPMLARYQAGELVNLTGDFDGDGFHDLALRRRSDRIEVHLWREADGFQREPALSVTLSADADATVADIDADGRSDIVVRREPPDGQAPEIVVHFTRGNAP